MPRRRSSAGAPMTRLVCLTLCAAASIASADVSIHGEKSATIDCKKDPNVSIQSGDGAFTLTGPCAKISINGGQNKITIESVKKLAINGAGNAVDVGTAEKIGIVGNDNVVTW